MIQHQPPTHIAASAPLNDDPQAYNAIAHAYEEGRVDYPAWSIENLCAAVGYTNDMIICDLAAGTGKLTKALLNYNPHAHILAVEPSENMCTEFRKQLPQIIVKQGSGERIPLPRESVDLVAIGTAFHWFANEQSLTEIARILKPGGKLVLIWNVFDVHEPWVQNIRSLLDAYRDTKEQTYNHDSLQWRNVFEEVSLFQPLQHVTHHYHIQGSHRDVIGRIRASKIFGTLTSAQQTSVITAAYNALEKYALPAESLPIPYRIELYWTKKLR